MVLAENLLLTLAILAGIVLGADLVVEWLRRRRDRQRLAALDGDARTRAEELDREARPDPLRRRLEASGLPLNAAGFFAGAMLVAVVAFLVLLDLFPAAPLAAVAGGLVAAVICWLLLGQWGQLRARRFEIKLVDAVGFMVGALEAGQNPVQAFASAADASDGAVAKELTAVTERLEVGIGIRRALAPILRGYDAPGTRLFVQTIVAKWETGGDLAPVLESVARVMRERLRLRLRLQSQLAGARLSAVLIAILPYLAVPVFLWQRPEWIDRLVTHPAGPQLLVAAVMLQIVGFLWLRRLLRVEL